MTADDSNGWPGKPAQRLRKIRRRLLPALIWLLAVGSVIALLQTRSRQITGVGIADPQWAMVTAPAPGKIQCLAVDMLDTVAADQVIGTMDTSVLDAELAVAKAEIARLAAQVEATKAQIGFDATAELLQEIDSQRRFSLNEEQARLGLLDRQVQHEADKVTLRSLEIARDRQRRMVEEGLLDAAAYDIARLECEALQKRIEENEKALAMDKKRMEEAGKRQQELATARTNPALDPLLEPVREEIRVQEARIQEIGSRREQLVLRAPNAGQVATVLKRAGENALQGEQLLTIAIERTQRVLAYVPEKNIPQIAVGDRVTIRSRSAPLRVAQATITKVGDHVQLMPTRLWRSLQFEQYGMPLIVSDLSNDLFLPGEVVDMIVLPAK
ncbi:MAG TPA: HlyD family efflux transporter periplasmic adaptor subunit [Candidatus Hydrogenedentes bacterium]|nr:HlyD family efflux transporter periplasmic adaptor subunit [Candidatus Hydrogenedentota bacterium]HOS03801.1 HlyD family efflux transporter periplasmic adaptor subunit [Candidatus Hydrogenedentota bacterium]